MARVLGRTRSEWPKRHVEFLRNDHRQAEGCICYIGRGCVGLKAHVFLQPLGMAIQHHQPHPHYLCLRALAYRPSPSLAKGRSGCQSPRGFQPLLSSQSPAPLVWPRLACADCPLLSKRRTSGTSGGLASRTGIKSVGSEKAQRLSSSCAAPIGQKAPNAH